MSTQLRTHLHIATLGPHCHKVAEEDFVEFGFVNTVGMNGLQIEILDYYGTNGGLNGIELFQNDAFTFANQSYNMENSCNEDKFAPVSILDGNFASPDVSGSTYVTAVIDQASQISETAVMYQPNITLSGKLLLFALYTWLYPGRLLQYQRWH